MKVLIVDNYDSFTYNLFHYVQACDVSVDVVRNDRLDFDAISSYDKLIISPGPGLPKETINMFELYKEFGTRKPILGVCLGMQGLSEFFGARLVNQEIVKHGVQENITVKSDSKLFSGIPSSFNVGLYHSWMVDANSIPADLICTSISENNVVMSVEHKTLPLFGVQFHPESILTEYGQQLILNFLNL